LKWKVLSAGQRQQQQKKSKSKWERGLNFSVNEKRTTKKKKKKKKKTKKERKRLDNDEPCESYFERVTLARDSRKLKIVPMRGGSFKKGGINNRWREAAKAQDVSLS
jgi:hypothetical protein